MQLPREGRPTVLSAVLRILLTLAQPPLPLLLLLSVPTEAAAAAFDGGAATGACEPIRIPMCFSMPWNMTGLPNHLHQSSQYNALLSIEQYRPLADIGCSPLLIFYLCAMYAPICLTGGGGGDAPVPPCRRVCESVRSACEPVVRRHGRLWPEAFSCDGLPTYEEGVCISPEAIAPLPVASAATSRPLSSPLLIAPSTASPAAANSEDGRGSSRPRGNMVDKDANASRDADRICTGDLKFKKSTYLNNNYDYVIRVKYDGQKAAGRGDGPRATNASGVEVSVVRVLRKTGRLRSGLRIGATVILWTLSPPTGGGGSGCSSLRRGNEYLVACYADPSDGRLLFDPQRCMLARWKDGWTRTEWNRLADEALKPAERRPMSSPPPAPSTTQIADQLH